MTSRRTAVGDDAAIERGDGVPPRPLEEYPLPPGPDGYPLVGNTLSVVRDPFAFYDELATHGDVVRYRVAGRTFTALLHPDYVERVLVSEPGRFERYVFADLGFDIGTEGLLMTDGTQWKRQRRLLQPAFTIDRIETYAETMVECAERTADSWIDGSEVALNSEFSELTLRILAKALFDVEVDPATDGEVIARAARAINERVNARNLSTFLPQWVPLPANRRYERTMRAYREQVDALIDRRRSADSSGEADDLLSIMLRASDDRGGTLSETEVRDNLVTFLFAGHETSSLALTYALMLLARHDDVAATLRAELEEVIGDERPTAAHVPELEYADAVLTEAMRLYPPAYILFRKATDDAVIGGYRIPAGTILTLPQFHLHVDDRFYDDPEEFRPERWLDDDRDRPEYAYFPFGGGPRHCIGMRFATLEMTLIVAVLLCRFDFELSSEPDPEPSAAATLQPENDVRVRVRRR
ncbi:cytochrome P450 [Natrarchaeobius oligotrophus]|uniref:Cytochrome P450 n=1 Tax=Natrarchaeobius chitinivorans TaxID=1679083 RepID=A0A3N6PUC0_NATCH|nr:cytochrome P450 [Natrarchaeobius chitinivorans]RQH03356.1 cytochrome P450 [Natrarchaeobius chitinivorans]